jgi:hypothetical protein
LIKGKLNLQKKFKLKGTLRLNQLTSKYNLDTSM